MSRRFTAMLTAMALLGTLVLPASASEVNTNGNASSVPVQVTAEAATFSVTVPTGLPVNVDSEGVVTVADNASIANNSAGPVKVTDVQITGLNGWSIVSFTKDYTTSEIGLKEVGFTMNGDPTLGGGGRAFSIDPC